MAKAFAAKLIPERLRELREAAGFSQRDLAEKLGRQQPSVAHWETGRSKLSPEMIAALCPVLGIEPSDLFRRDGTKRKGR